MHVWGYARVSTDEQASGWSLAAQRDAIIHAATARNFPEPDIIEEVSSGAGPRPKLQTLLSQLQKGDILIVYSIDRLSRSARELLEIFDKLNELDVQLITIREGEFSGPIGRLVYAVLAAVADFERELIRERTRRGLETARAAGKQLGRPRRHNYNALREKAEKLLKQGLHLKEVSKRLGIPRSTLYYILNAK